MRPYNIQITPSWPTTKFGKIGHGDLGGLITLCKVFVASGIGTKARDKTPKITNISGKSYIKEGICYPRMMFNTPTPTPESELNHRPSVLHGTLIERTDKDLIRLVETGK